MGTKPISELVSPQRARRYLKNDFLLLIYRGGYLKAIQDKKDFHCSMASTFVAIDEGMVFND